MKLKLILGLFLVIILPVLIWAVATQRIELRKRAATAGVTLALQPATTTSAVGQTINLGILMNMEGGITSLSAMELHFTYDPSVLQFQAYTNGTALPNILAPETHSNGQIYVAIAVPPTSPYTGSAIIGSLQFTVLKTNATAVDITSQTQAAVVGYNVNMLTSSTGSQINGSVTTTNTPTPTPTITIVTNPCHISFNLNIPTATPTVTPTITPTPSSAPMCIALKIYKNNVLLTDADLATLQPGDVLTFALTPSGLVTKAHFRINGGSWNETTTKNSAGEFIWNWTIPTGLTTFTVEGELFNGTNWY